MNNVLYKKFSVGISLDISVQEYEEFLHNYGSYVDSFYFSPPIGDQFQSRRSLKDAFHDEAVVKKFYQIIALIKRTGIKLAAVLNTFNLSARDIQLFAQFCEQNQITEITLLDSYRLYLEGLFSGDMHYIYSYNNSLSYTNIDYVDSCYDNVVLGTKFLRDLNFINELSSKRNIRLLLNNGCSPNCFTCKYGSARCLQVIQHNLETKSENQIYAEQSFFPWEFHKMLDGLTHLENVSFKISNRTSDYQYLCDCIDSYIHGKDVSHYISKTYRNYHLWFRLGMFSRHYRELSLEEIEAIKREIAWT